jgi:hypothetical protein
MGPSSEDQSKVKQHKTKLIWIYALCAFYLFGIVNYLSVMHGIKNTKYSCEILKNVHIQLPHGDIKCRVVLYHNFTLYLLIIFSKYFKADMGTLFAKIPDTSRSYQSLFIPQLMHSESS